MSKKKKNKSIKSAGQEKRNRKPKESYARLLWTWVIPVLLITGVAFIPMLSNEFTNWDDEFYVIQNGLLRGPDWPGIFSKAIVSNYHPITIASLAFNYSMTQLDASSYLVTNYLLHLINTGLVFYFIWLISNKKIWVAACTAILFGIHPMHVESVAWISERKDVLYTLFFLLAMIQYWKYLGENKFKNLVYCFIFFCLSILSKPAAIIFPFILFTLDYWYGRKFTSKVITEKISFLLIAVIFAFLTVKLQSRTAIASLDFYPIWARFFFATYSGMIYIVRFFVPYPLSAFHPFPATKSLGLPLMLSPIFIAGILTLVWYFRKNKLVVFSFFFFFINLILVLQIVAIGGTLLSERYTYMPYIGLAFIIAMYLDQWSARLRKKIVWGSVAVVLIIFGYITFERTKVWKDSFSLWTDTIKHFPDAPVPRTNRANYLIKFASRPENFNDRVRVLQIALEDCNAALKSNANHAKGYENRMNIYIMQNNDSLAFKDANSLLTLEPANKNAFYVKGSVYQHKMMTDSSLYNLNKCLEINPNTDFALNSRGSLYYNQLGKYKEALDDFNRAIQINPQGDYYLNRSLCHYKLGDIELARNDANTAKSLGKTIPESLKSLLGL